MIPLNPTGKVKGQIEKSILDLRSLPWFRWQPGWDTLVAPATMLYMIPSYYLMANSLHSLAIYNFLFASLFILVLLPAYYVLKVRGEPLEQLGLTKRHWLSSLLISLAIVWRFTPRLVDLLSSIPQELVLPTVLFNGLCLWEPFFVHCWVQLRFERAFGVIPGILAAGLCLASYHIGTYPPEMVVILGLVGLMYGVVFRLTRNLLILWPLTWTGASTMGTVSGGFTFGWKTVWIYAAILLTQIIGIWWLARSQHNLKTHRRDDFNVSEKSATRNMSWKDWLLSYIYGGFMIVQIVITIFKYNHLGLDLVANTGWLIMAVSAVFGWIPIATFRKKGEVPEGKSYMHTTVLVDSGIYSVIRHPQFFAGILISFALVLISQYWLNAVLFVPVVAGTYIDSLRADKDLIEKFGDDYKLYMRRVSGLNPLVGIIRLLQQRRFK
jgi:protein-S-isoprenylcysteine O-methyltransferase Ste14